MNYTPPLSYERKKEPVSFETGSQRVKKVDTLSEWQESLQDKEKGNANS